MPERTDHNEAMMLAEACKHGWLENVDPDKCSLDDLLALLRQQAERIAETQAERDQHQATATALIALLADIRKACGDNGKRMQPELVEFIGAMSTERDQLRAEVERMRESCAVISWNHYMDTCKRLGVSASENYAWCSAKSIRDAARTTHKD